MFDPHVVNIHRFVVPLAAVGDGIFECANAGLQLHEMLVGAQFRIGLRDREQPAQARPQRPFGAAECRQVVPLLALATCERAAITLARVLCSNCEYWRHTSTSFGNSS